MALVKAHSIPRCGSCDRPRAAVGPAARERQGWASPWSSPRASNSRSGVPRIEIAARRQSTFTGTRFCPGSAKSVARRASGGGASGAARAVFTGIVEEMGVVRELRQVENGGFEMTIGCEVVLEDVKLGDSISVNGTCLTVTRFDAEEFSVGLAPETLRRTALGEAAAGAAVNLERSVQPSSRMGGHIVQGHVDGTGTIVEFRPENDSLWLKVRAPPELLRYIVPKGYISVDGTSLTVVDVLDDESAFTFMLVAYTQQRIVLPLKRVGSKVNLEVDIVGKYVERLLRGYQNEVSGMPPVSPIRIGAEMIL